MTLILCSPLFFCFYDRKFGYKKSLLASKRKKKRFLKNLYSKILVWRGRKGGGVSVKFALRGPSQKYNEYWRLMRILRLPSLPPFFVFSFDFQLLKYLKNLSLTSLYELQYTLNNLLCTLIRFNCHYFHRHCSDFEPIFLFLRRFFASLL